jgi:hypothetical protein
VRLIAAVAVCVGVALVVIAVTVRHGSGTSAVGDGVVNTVTGPTSSRPSVRVPVGFPAPPRSAVVFFRADRGSVLALAVTPGHPLGLQASVLGPDGTGTKGLRVAFAVDGAKKTATVCGAGCYRSAVVAAGRPREVDVTVHGRRLDARWRLRLPAQWPAPSGAALMADAGRVWRSLRSLAYVEHLASDPKHQISSDWRVGAPDRAAYKVLGGNAGIVIGGLRWDKAPGGDWVKSAQTATITQPVPFWVSPTNAYVVGSGFVDGHPVWRISFFDPGTPGWFEVALDKQTKRTLRLQMMATAHFMHDSYSAFNTATPITPP